jgi:hypothetical protein|eukprot:COSAG06_NODE_7379_length_2522_cov_26.686752_3_plen_96_part_00
MPYTKGRRLQQVCDAVYECGDDCPVGEECRLKCVQRGLQRDIEIYKTDGKGWGARCWSKLSAGDFVCEYAGKETRLFEPFLYKNDHFTKTGSGQT